MKALIGLGNPGRQYEATRHNAGFIVVDCTAEAAGAPAFKKTRWKGLTSRAEVAGRPVVLAKPQAFMNLSGHFVSSLLGFYRIPSASALVVHDDMDLPLGRVRFARGGGSAGHRGVKSIMEQLGTPEFHRLKLGVGKPPGTRDASAHVLSAFDDEEWEVFRQVVECCVPAVERWVADDIDTAMNEFNSVAIGPQPQEGGE